MDLRGITVGKMFVASHWVATHVLENLSKLFFSASTNLTTTAINVVDVAMDQRE